MPSANANPAALVNFIFRQLPDDVLDAIGAHRGGAYHQDAGASGVPPWWLFENRIKPAS
jgi:hypothetical protein